MAKDPDISTHLHQPQVLGIDLGERRLSWGDSLKMVLLAVFDCGNSSTGDTSSCCGRNGGGDRPDSAQQSIAIGSAPQVQPMQVGELPE